MNNHDIPFDEGWTVEQCRHAVNSGFSDEFWEGCGEHLAKILLAEIDRLNGRGRRIEITATEGPGTTDCS